MNLENASMTIRRSHRRCCAKTIKTAITIADAITPNGVKLDISYGANARRQVRLEAGARHERTLAAVQRGGTAQRFRFASDPVLGGVPWKAHVLTQSRPLLLQ